jgi:hypothetical protein
MRDMSGGGLGPTYSVDHTERAKNRRQQVDEHFTQIEEDEAEDQVSIVHELSAQ